jgi:anti-sigma factor RsiW
MISKHRSTVGRRLKGAMLKHLHGMITCKEFEQFIMAYLDGELPSRKKVIFEWHLRLCRECRDYLAAYQRSVELGKACLTSTDEPVPSDVPQDLIKAILDANSSSR